MALTPTEKPKQRAFAGERAELEVVIASRTFVRAPLLSRMLVYVCEQYFSGQASTIKEYSIATDALGRGPDFDPDTSSIVRVMASRLRKRLVDYYAGEGAGHRIKIHLPETGYTPVFTTEPVNLAPTIVIPRRSPHPWLAAAAILLLAAPFAYLAFRYTRPQSTEAKTAIPALPVSPGGATAAIRIGAGLDRDRVDSAGVLWASDRYYDRGVARRFAERPIRRTLDPMLYLTAREGDFRYDIPLPPGVYEVHLHFAETVHGIRNVGDFGEGQRMFDVLLNQQTLLTGFDIITDAAGSNVADERVFKDVSPAADGLLHLRFRTASAGALLNAIEILRGTKGEMLPLRIAAASETPIYDKEGRLWRRDQYFIGGNSVKWIRAIGGPEDQSLYYCHRWGHFDYAIPAADGKYKLTLRFAESYYGAESETGGTHAGGVGSRLFDVFCNGEALIRRLDVFKEGGGPSREVVKTFHNLEPNAQGKLNLSFVPVKGPATISAIEVVPE